MFVISIRHSLHFCTNFKRTHTGCYLPQHSNNRSAHKWGWIRGETARYLCTNAHKQYFALASERLRLSLIWLHYPKHTWEPLRPSWSDQDRYLVRRPRQCAGVTIHALRLPYFASVCLFPSKLSNWVTRNLRTLLPKTKLCVTHHSMSKMKGLWRRFAMQSPWNSLLEGGREDFFPRLTAEQLLAIRNLLDDA